MKYYVALALLGLVFDYIVGELLTGFWTYPFYSHTSDWLRLYILIYPIGGLSVVELIYFLSSLFKEKIVLVHEDVKTKTVYKYEYLVHALIVLAIVVCLLFKDNNSLFYVQIAIAILVSIWIVLTTLELRYYLKHWTHWVSIIAVTTILSIFLHEVPNTAVYEWKYNVPSLLSLHPILSLQIWLIYGWYLLVLVMLKYWIQIVLLKGRERISVQGIIRSRSCRSRSGNHGEI
mgnify:FL=1